MRGILVALVLVVLAVAGCEDDDGSGGNAGSGGAPASSVQVDDGCTESHPTRAASDPPGFVIACSGDGGYSLHVENTSNHVLRVWPNVPETTRFLIDPPASPSAGTAAAAFASGQGWSYDRRTFVLPLGHALTVTSMDDPSVGFEADPGLTGAALLASYYGQFAHRRLGGSRQANAQRVAGCVESAQTVISEGAYVEDVLRESLGLYRCRTLLSDVLDQAGSNPSLELPRARSQLYKIAEPALDTRLISRAAQILR